MLKRSFLEFHAQKAAPEAAKALARGQSALASLRAAPWPLPPDAGIPRSDVGEYVALNARIDSLSRKLQVRQTACSKINAALGKVFCMPYQIALALKTYHMIIRFARIGHFSFLACEQHTTECPSSC